MCKQVVKMCANKNYILVNVCILPSDLVSSDFESIHTIRTSGYCSLFFQNISDIKFKRKSKTNKPKKKKLF